jgi:hypothetical protein
LVCTDSTGAEFEALAIVLRAGAFLVAAVAFTADLVAAFFAAVDLVATFVLAAALGAAVLLTFGSAPAYFDGAALATALTAPTRTVGAQHTRLVRL